MLDFIFLPPHLRKALNEEFKKILKNKGPRNMSLEHSLTQLNEKLTEAIKKDQEEKENQQPRIIKENE